MALQAAYGFGETTIGKRKTPRRFVQRVIPLAQDQPAPSYNPHLTLTSSTERKPQEANPGIIYLAFRKLTSDIGIFSYLVY